MLESRYGRKECAFEASHRDVYNRLKSWFTISIERSFSVIEIPDQARRDSSPISNLVSAYQIVWGSEQERAVVHIAWRSYLASKRSLVEPWQNLLPDYIGNRLEHAWLQRDMAVKDNPETYKLILRKWSAKDFTPWCRQCAACNRSSHMQRYVLSVWPIS